MHLRPRRARSCLAPRRCRDRPRIGPTTSCLWGKRKVTMKIVGNVTLCARNCSAAKLVVHCAASTVGMYICRHLQHGTVLRRAMLAINYERASSRFKSINAVDGRRVQTVVLMLQSDWQHQASDSARHVRALTADAELRNAESLQAVAELLTRHCALWPMLVVCDLMDTMRARRSTGPCCGQRSCPPRALNGRPFPQLPQSLQRCRR